MQRLLVKTYKYRLNILACVFLGFGFLIFVKNLSFLIGFCFNSRTLEDLSINSLRSGICIKDELSYTCGKIGEIVGRKSTKIYVVDIGKNHNQYMEMHSEQNNSIDKLYTLSPGNYQELNSSNKVKLYAVVEKEHILFTDYFTRLSGMVSDEGESKVSYDYTIKVVNLNDYKVNLLGGILLLISGGAVAGFIYLKARKASGVQTEKTDMEEEHHNEEHDIKPVGLFDRGILEGREILSVELVWQNGTKVFKQSEIIDRITANLNDVADGEGIKCEGDKLCTFTFVMEDCTFINFEVWDKPVVKSVEGFYHITEEAYDDLYKIFGKEIYNDEKKLQP